MKNKTLYINGIAALAALLLLGAVFIWAPVCQKTIQLASGSSTPMRCFYTGKAAVMLAIVTLALSVELLVRKKAVAFPYIAAGVLLVLLPAGGTLGIGICAADGMACHATALWIYISGGLLILSGIAGLLTKGEREIK